MTAEAPSAGCQHNCAPVVRYGTDYETGEKMRHWVCPLCGSSSRWEPDVWEQQPE